MNRRFSLIAGAVILALTVGCGAGSGGGTRSIVAGTTSTTAAYGWSGADDQLGFVIFTDIDSQGSIGSASGKWKGYIKPTTGPAVRYESVSGGLDINGTNYDFANGRVFLASAKEGNISVSQLDIPIGDAKYDAEIDRIGEIEEVQKFLSK
jgi:hypothetical protein